VLAPKIYRLCLLPLLGVSMLAPRPAAAISHQKAESPLAALVFVSDRLRAAPELEPAEEVEASLDTAVRNGWGAFQQSHGIWSAVIDKRNGRIEIAEGEGIPFVPGRGNQLAERAGSKPDLAALDRVTRGFLTQVAPLLGVDPASLRLNQGRSGQPAEHLWNVDYDVEIDGLPVEGARVVFRVNNGNLIQFGSENLPHTKAVPPPARVTRDEALANLAAYIGGFGGGDLFVDGGSQRLLTVRVEDARFTEGYEPGRGRGLTPAWQFIFRHDRGRETWRARVDAVSGEMLELIDINRYAQATGGAKFLGVSSNVPMPFADLSSGGATSSAGVYSYPGGPVTSSLDGPYVSIADNCGPISLPANALGTLAFGTSAGTDCTTPGFGGAGNTHSARTQFYHVNRAKEIARGWLPANAWLNGQLTTNVNLNDTCNAFWNGSTINFYRSGGGCGNTGEIEGVSLHEYGHGLDDNDGNGSFTDFGTGETYGDWTAALATHTSCVGSGFDSVSCGGYGDACTSCTGIRDIDWGKHVSNTPHTVANFTQTLCPNDPGYTGPCGKEGHCESYISSEALWDFVNRDLPNPGSGAAWAVADRLWYLSRSTATAAFSCTAGATFTSNGCNVGSLWKTLRAVDDDDGNLANGTPNSAALYAAFNRHGIACTTDAGANTSFRGCSSPAVPTLSLTGGDNQVSVNWSGSAGVYDVYRNERGCDAGFARVANDLPGSALVDANVANGFTYYYQVTAQPAGNESCASAPSACLAVTPQPPPCAPLAAPTGLVAFSAGVQQTGLAWTAVPGATRYHVYRATSPGGSYTLAGTSTGLSFSDTGLTCGAAWYYAVRAASSDTCESASSLQAVAATTPCPPCATQTLYTNGFETGTGLADWAVGTFDGGSAADWRGIQTCTAAAGSKIFRFGGTTCSADYSDNDGEGSFTFAQPGGASGLAIPAGATDTRLSFQHRRNFELDYDGGTLAVSLDGDEYFLVPSSAILSGPTYDSTIEPFCAPAGAAGIPVFTGTASFGQSLVDLDAACDSAGGTDGCAGQSLRIGFTSITDCNTTGDGWFLDNVEVTSCVPSGLPTGGTDFYSLAPCRAIDTRLAAGPLGAPALQPGTERAFALSGVCGIPPTARALAVNATVFQATSLGFIQIYPGDAAAPTTSTVNFLPGATRANNAIVPLASDGTVTLKVRSGTTQPVTFILDVFGYFE
jgi:hypothetical protein